MFGCVDLSFKVRTQSVLLHQQDSRSNPTSVT